MEAMSRDIDTGRIESVGTPVQDERDERVARTQEQLRVAFAAWNDGTVVCDFGLDKIINPQTFGALMDVTFGTLAHEMVVEGEVLRRRRTLDAEVAATAESFDPNDLDDLPVV